MIKSMTGFGRVVFDTPNKNISIEIKSLNSKQIDIKLKLPHLYKEKELEIRKIITQKLERGKIDFSIYYDSTGEKLESKIDKDLALNYYNELSNLADEINCKKDTTDFLSLLVKMPDVFKPEREILDVSEYEILKENIIKAIDLLDKNRLEEGKILEKDFINRINKIDDLLKDISPFEADRINKIKERIINNIQNFVTDKSAIDNNRLEQELIYYIEKIDITEEKVRLHKHCDYFLETLKEEKANGKKLNFICQEIGREINTLGAKSNDINIQKIVVQMKDELEKVKEQVLNIL